MEKLGVVIDPSMVKTGSEKQHCPDCGRELPTRAPDGDILPQNYCIRCGTKPFEKRPEAK